MTTKEELDGYLSKSEAAEYLSLSLRTIEVRLDEIPHFRVGRKLLFRKSELDRWMAQHREQGNEADLRHLANEAAKQILGGD